MSLKNSDHTKVREDLINRVENIVKLIIRQAIGGQFPKIDNNVSSSSIPIVLDDLETIEFDTNNDEVNEINTLMHCQIDTRDDDNDENDEGEEEEEDEEENEMEVLVSQTRDENNSQNFVVDFSRKKGQIQLALMMIIISKAHKLLIANDYQTKRSLYYELKDQGLVDKQDIVDRCINKIANFLQCTTWDLGFIPTVKGLISGDVILSLEDGGKIDCNAMGGVLVPPAKSIITKIESNISFIIVVEKDAVFQKLLLDDCPRKYNCLVITGKGYPDISTRIFLKSIMEKLNIPAYILVDADPHGIEIMCVYKYGSASLEWENSSLISSKIQWIGVAPSDIFLLNVKSHPLSDCDKRKLETLEKKFNLPDKLKEELIILRQGKIDIETVSSIAPKFLTQIYIPCKIQTLKNNVEK